MANVIKTYQSLREFLGAVSAGACNYRMRDSFGGGRDIRTAIKYVTEGAAESSRELMEAKKLLADIDSSFRDRSRNEWVPSICGAYPIVPDYLIGLPESMRMQTPVDSDVSPIRIIMEPLVSAGVSDNELVRRGAAVTAMAMRLTEERPVELYVALAMRKSRTDYCALIKMDTQPLDISVATAVFSSASFSRMIAFNWTLAVGATQQHNIRWGLDSQPGKVREEAMRKVFNLEPQDIVLQGGYLTDAALMQRDPVQWVHNQIEKQRTLDS